jgi:hypothetical protein
MILIDGLMALAMLFFLVWPIMDTDVKTERMKLSVLGSQAALFALSVVAPYLMH